jgi:hypothetical protein
VPSGRGDAPVCRAIPTFVHSRASGNLGFLRSSWVPAFAGTNGEERFMPLSQRLWDGARGLRRSASATPRPRAPQSAWSRVHASSWRAPRLAPGAPHPAPRASHPAPRTPHPRVHARQRACTTPRGRLPCPLISATATLRNIEKYERLSRASPCGSPQLPSAGARPRLSPHPPVTHPNDVPTLSRRSQRNP